MEPDSATQVFSCSTSTEEAVPEYIVRQDLTRQLPTEILEKVLCEAAPLIWYDPSYYRSLFRIRAVCRRWLDIVDEAQSLWTSIWLQFKLDLISMVLVKSKMHLLSIWYDDQTFAGYDSLPEDHISSFIDLVGPSASRWEFFDYRASSYAEHGRVLGLPFDNLRRLNILLSGNITYASALNTKKLTYLNVHRCSLNWHSISGLRNLEIDQNTYGPDVGELVAVLRASPDLERLEVTRNWPMSATASSDSQHPLPPIFLPKLREMSFSKLPVVPLSILLDLIEAPNLHRFSHSMTYKWISDDFPCIFGSAGRHIGADSQSGRGGDPIQLDITSHGDTFGIKLGDREIVLSRFGWEESNGRQEREASLSAALARFHPNLRSLIKTVSFKDAPWNDEVAGYLRLVHTHFPRVEELILMVDANVEPIVEMISWEQETRNVDEVLFPCLTTLRLHATQMGSMLCGSSILHLVEGRADSARTATLKVVGLEGSKIAVDTAERLRQSLQELRLTNTEVVDSPELIGSIS
ncbi:hypothetical protein M407DRAFT_32573 [Tulasnella calospora MUT 4182]|uniref:F-box domain-containing protein n=1 Tax=Tulasnella calospora MUT 4182 TaxID=1051891 RepID=A0A0C3Q3R0_9AGAM|nr:hypothetical protein M407DRAFT_32573 [Tulasnella calospora MUT 4182]